MGYSFTPRGVSRNGQLGRCGNGRGFIALPSDRRPVDVRKPAFAGCIDDLTPALMRGSEGMLGFYGMTAANALESSTPLHRPLETGSDRFALRIAHLRQHARRDRRKAV